MSLKFYNQPPYFDDFDEAKNYLRMLFRPGYAVQARELTQLQTVLQNQIGRFGENVFQDGSAVVGGEPTFNPSQDFVKIEDTHNGSLNVENYYDEFIGTTVTGQTSGVKGKVVAATARTNGDPITLYVKYTSGSTDGNQSTFLPEETIRSDGSTIREATVKPALETPTGKGSIYSILPGVFFVNSSFVYTEAQSIIFSKYNETKPSARILLRVDEKVVTSSDDLTLNDNALGSPNESAPGAHRYNVELTLVSDNYELDQKTVENSIQIAVIKDGVLISETKGSQYNEILKVMAERTKEESGDYTVTPYKGLVKGHKTDPNKMSISIEPAIAYIEGYRVENITTKNIDIDRARDENKDVKEFISSSTFVSYGNYVTVENIEGLPDITTFNNMNLLNSNSDIIGTARARSFEPVGGDQYRLYLFDIKVTVGTTADLVSVEYNGTPNFTADLVTPGVIEEAGSNRALFATPFKGTKHLEQIELQTTKNWSTTVSSDIATFQTGSGNELFIDFNNFVMYNEQHGQIDLSQCTITPGGTTVGQSITITGAPIQQANNSIVYLIAKTQKTLGQATAKQKTLLTSTTNINTPNTIKGGYDSLQELDIYRIKNIYMSPDFVTPANDTHQNVTFRYELDNGQRDNFYDVGRIRLKTDSAAPTGRLLVEYEYFGHGPGDFFTVDSYNGQVDWGDIPSYEGVSLANYIDCRPRKDWKGKNFTGSGSSLVEFVANNSLISANIEVYLSRKDKVYVQSNGQFGVARGISDVNPKPPVAPNGAMVIFDVDIPPYTHKLNEVALTAIDNKRYTMRDIGKLEKRINNLEYYTTLSLLEKDVLSASTLASDGSDRFRNGFVVDGFYNHNVNDVRNSDNKVSLDTKAGTLRPPYYMDSVEFDIDESLSTNPEINGTILTLPITDHVAVIEQPYASGTENLNPYLVFKYNCKLDLSPSNDNWFDVEEKPSTKVDLTGLYDAIEFLAEETGVVGVEWNAWETKWSGSTTSSSRRGNTITTTTTTTIDQERFGQETTISGQVAEQSLGERVVDINMIPFIRARRVYFYAGNMKPSTRVYMFMDEENISDYARNEMSNYPDYEDWLASTGDVNVYKNLETHPEGSNELVTNENGEIWGSFIVPSNSTLKFNTGERVVRLTDDVNNDQGEAYTTAEAVYAATGFVKTVSDTVISTKIPQFDVSELSDSRTLVNTTVSRRTINRDPLAQTFSVPESCFISKFETFFKTKSDKEDVTFQIRPVENGYPTKNVISEVIVKNADVQVSEDATLATTFNLKEPLYLKEGVEYAFVLKSNDDQYRVWVSELGEYDVTDSNFRITKQPAAGVLFKSANDSTWKSEQFKDIKFTMYRASFDTSQERDIFFKPKFIQPKLLGNDPFITYNDSSVVRVKHNNHGMFEGSKVSFTGVSEGDSEINGINVSNFNNTFTIFDVEFGSYCIDVGFNANADGSGGGTEVFATENKGMDLCKVGIESVLLPNTSLLTYIKTANGKSFGDTVNPYQMDEDYKGFVVGENLVFDNTKVIASEDNESLINGSLTENSGHSTYLKCTLSSGDERLSPVIDLERVSVVAVKNKIDNPVAPADYEAGINNEIADDPNGLQRFVSEESPKDNSCSARYITKKVILEEEASDLKIWLKVNRPSGSFVDVYYRIQQDENQTLEDTSWVYFEPLKDAPQTDDVNRYSEVEYDAEDIGTFGAFQIKIVMRSNNTSKTPTVKDFRAVALS